VTKPELAQLMVGRPVAFERQREKVAVGDARLKLKGVNVQDEHGQQLLRDIELTVNSGEIVGVAGVSGNGQKPLAEVIMGLQAATTGTISLDGQEATAFSPAQRLEMGLSYIPEERMHDGVVKDFTVAENLILQDHRWTPFSRNTFLNFKAIGDHAGRMIDSFRIKTPSQETPVKNLSGGNIQKLVMARELARQPRVLIAAQPTRGVDIGAIEYIHSQLLKQRSEGLATLLISEDLDEIRNLSDRIVVMFGGEIMGIVNNDETT
ncbi:MAG: ATP-binding cassette domain-containing protein, partial [Anaerolineales bacterium]|nr:ATP-binding cassette domain-containing protein [Anaerolineales bacterium]